MTLPPVYYRTWIAAKGLDAETVALHESRQDAIEYGGALALCCRQMAAALAVPNRATCRATIPALRRHLGTLVGGTLLLILDRALDTDRWINDTDQSPPHPADLAEAWHDIGTNKMHVVPEIGKVYLASGPPVFSHVYPFGEPDPKAEGSE